MGEAWFMGETRRMFPDLAGDLQGMALHDLQKPLVELASGVSSFGPLAEWTDWFHYLLPRVLHRCHETYVSALLEILITGFMTQHPDSLGPEPYAGFRRDALETLGRCLMDPRCWPDGRIHLYHCLNKYYVEPVGSWFFSDPSAKLSASLFLCLKYLPSDKVAPWMTSVLSIRSAHWRAQLMVWLVAAHDTLTGATRQPAEFQDDGVQLGWDWSHVLDGSYTGDYSGTAKVSEFIAPENSRQAIEAVRAIMTEDVFLAWLQSISRYDYLEAELADVPYWFNDLYGAGTA